MELFLRVTLFLGTMAGCCFGVWLIAWNKGFEKGYKLGKDDGWKEAVMDNRKSLGLEKEK